MNDKFKAIVLNKSGDQFTREIKTLDKSFFKTGNVTIKVEYSDLNFLLNLFIYIAGELFVFLAI